ncbi:hypothetical protein [Brevibacterium sp.]|uniref:hypothetical protein n=1 Tax=Brevibacterium sp. TaxID=1701 RepID=UPI0025BF947D|nr:hypothetical protein [Brevibacterium sp.]
MSPAAPPARSPRGSRNRTTALVLVSAVLGLMYSFFYHAAAINAWLPGTQVADPELFWVTLVSDAVLGILALCLVPAAIRHDDEELEEDTYIGPPSALVAGLVVITVWQVAPLAIAAGAVVIISISSRISASWTIPAVCASLFSALIAELAFFHSSVGIDWVVVGAVAAATVILVLFGTVRGYHLRSLFREREAAEQTPSADHGPQAEPPQASADSSR